MQEEKEMMYEIFKKEEETENGMSFERRILANGIKADGEPNIIGYVEVFYTEDAALCKSINVNKEYRNKGIGTQILKDLSSEFGGIYLCADNENAERLYSRIGEEIGYSRCPDMFESELDEYGNMYLI